MCPLLWTAFAIDCCGGVFSCCHMKPVKLGNINDAPLRELANTPPIIRERKNALGGTLECYKGCNLVRYAKHPPEFKSTTNDYNEMEYLHINFGERCNIACIMCKVHDRARYVRSILSPEILIKNIDLDPFIEIVIQGGEPLFIPECMEYLEYLGKIGKKYVLLTNGLLITDEVALQLARDAMRVCISINAASKDTHERVNRGSSFDVVNANIKKLISARDRLGSDLVLHGRMTITPIAINVSNCVLNRHGLHRRLFYFFND